MKAIVSCKECVECGVRAPVGEKLDHAENCTGICRLVMGIVELQPGDTVEHVCQLCLYSIGNNYGVRDSQGTWWHEECYEETH